MILISSAAVPLSNCLNNILKRRNLPTLMSAFCLLKIVQITVLTNITFLGYSTKEETPVNGLPQEQETLSIFNEKPNIENKTFNVGITFTNYSLGDQDGGANQIFSSIFQTPSFTFHDTSILTNIFITVGVLLFSPYMYIYRYIYIYRNKYSIIAKKLTSFSEQYGGCRPGLLDMPGCGL